jgi:hypothetical protein
MNTKAKEPTTIAAIAPEDSLDGATDGSGAAQAAAAQNALYRTPDAASVRVQLHANDDFKSAITELLLAVLA